MEKTKSNYWLTLLLIFAAFSTNAQTETITHEVNFEPVSFEVIYTHRDTLNGMVRAVHASDTSKIALKCHYKNGKLNGRYLTWYPNGNYLMTVIYGYGKMHGDYTEYNDNGALITKGKYRDGIQHGFWTYKIEGCRGQFKKGVRHGKWKCYDQNLELISIRTYQMGELMRDVPIQ